MSTGDHRSDGRPDEGDTLELRLILNVTDQDGKARVEGSLDGDGIYRGFDGWIALLGAIESVVEQMVGAHREPTRRPGDRSARGAQR